MKNGKNILIFILINVLVILVTIVMPFIPATKIYNAYHHELPKVGNNSFAQNMGIIVKQLDTVEQKVALTDMLRFGVVDRGEIFYNNFVWLYIMFGIMLGVLIIALGIVLKYKSENKIYSKAFITAGIIVVIVYIFILSILLQKNVFYAYF